MPLWLKKTVTVGVLVLFAAMSFSQTALAGTPRRKGPSTKKILTVHKLKLMARHIAADLSHQDVFIKKDLPAKMSLGLFEVSVPNATATGRDFTDAVLNEILNASPVLIVNQDAQMGESLNYKLERYEDDKTMRTRAALLGASFYLIGEVTPHTLTNKRGKIQDAYKVDFSVFEVHNNNIILKHNLIFTEGGKLLKENKPNGRRQKNKR